MNQKQIEEQERKYIQRLEWTSALVVLSIGACALICSFLTKFGFLVENLVER